MSDQKGHRSGLHLSAEQIKKYSAKILEPGDLLIADDHLTGCAECRAKLPENFSAIGDSFFEELMERNEEEHLSYDEIVLYMENRDATGREQMQTHLESCPRCTADLNDLKSYAKEFEPDRPLRKFSSYRILAIAAVIALIAIAAALRFRKSEPQETRVTQGSAPLVVSIKEPQTRISLDEKGKLNGLKDAPQRYQQLVIDAIQTRIVETPASLQALIGKPGTVRGDAVPISFTVLSPVGTYVLNDQPLFQWDRLDGASEYRITILDEQMNLAAESGWIQATSWKTEKPLQRDRTYVWQVAAMRNGEEVLSPQPPAREARFRILDQTAADQLRMESARFKNSNLLLGLMFAQHGVLDDAQKHLQLVANANPESKEIKQLLENLQKLRM